MSNNQKIAAVVWSSLLLGLGIVGYNDVANNDGKQGATIMNNFTRNLKHVAIESIDTPELEG